ncbi:MAG: hypothetical protein RLY86_165 [Pseudomonadota bacterium]|jgi:flagellin-like hook-associated protein FlgL
MTVSTLNQYQQLLYNSNNLRERQNVLQQQVSSGYKAQVFSGLGTDSVRSIDLRNNLSEIDTYQRNIDEVRARTGIMNTAMNRVSEIARDVQRQLITPDGVSRADPAIIRQISRQAIQDIVQLLNTQVDGRFVFAGSSVASSPVNADNTLADFAVNEYAANFPADTAQLQQNIYNEVYRPDRSMTPPNGGNPQGLFNSALAQGGFQVSARIDRNFDVTYGVNADAEPFRQIIYGLTLAAGLQAPNPNTPANDESMRNLVRTARDALDQGGKALEREVGILGSIRSRVDLIDRKHDNVGTLLRTSLGEVEDTDVAKVASDLKLVETQIQATYSIISSQRRFSLVDFLT